MDFIIILSRHSDNYVTEDYKKILVPILKKVSESMILSCVVHK